MADNKTFRQLHRRTQEAVAHYWSTREAQQTKQVDGGKADQGLRSAVTGGAQMDGFVDLFADLVVDSGLPAECLHRKKRLELPGFFRPTKEWDLVVIRDGTLIAAIEGAIEQSRDTILNSRSKLVRRPRNSPEFPEFPKRSTRGA